MKGNKNMENQTQKTWLWQGLIAVAFLFVIGLNSAYAKNPFKDGDFVIMTELGGLEVQKHEITYAQWNALNSLLPSENQTPWEAKNCHLSDYIAKGFGPNYPAACISFKDAEAYIHILNAEDPNYTYRLPTNDELKMLIVDMTLGALKFNESISDERLSKHAWFSPNTNDHAHEVCTKESVFGLCDILGNVAEWTSSKLVSVLGLDIWVLGGNWRDEAHPSANYRNNHVLEGYPVFARPYSRHSTQGFRLVRTAK